MTHTDRETPVGTPFDEGYQSLITFSLDPDLSFWETIVDSPGFDGGDPVPVYTMHNTTYRCVAARSLVTVTPFQVKGKFSSGTIDQIMAIINDDSGWVTVQWPDGTQLSVPAYLKSFKADQSQEGAPLEGTIEIVPTMRIGTNETGYQVAEQGTGT